MTDYLGDPGPVDEISQDSGFSLPGRSAHRAATTPGARLTALSTALALVLAGGVVTAAWRSFSSQTAPERLVPASAFAVGTFDLGMRGQSDALSKFANHFPGSPTHHGDGSAVDRLLRAAFHGSSDPHLDYDRDVKPWLGHHVALAGWMDKAGKPQLQGLIESTDDNAARKVLDKLVKKGDGAFSFADGYVVLGSNPAAVQESINAAHHSSLADNTTYAADIDALPGDPALTAWMDGPAVRKAIEAALSPGDAKMFERMGPMGPLGMFGPMGLIGAAGTAGVGATSALSTVSSPFAGRTSLGVRVADNYVEMDSRSTGTATQHQASTATLRALPATTIATVELGDPASLVNGATSMLKGFFGLPTQLSMSSCSSGSVTAIIPPERAVPLSVRHRRQILRRLKALRHAHPPGNAGPCALSTPPAPPDPLKQIEKATGLQLPGDVTTVLGDSLLASYGGLSLHGVPKVAVRTHPADLSAARSVLDKVQTRLGVSSSFPLAVDTSGEDLVLATSTDYAHDVEQSGSFGQQAQVALALGDLPDAVDVAGYVDLSKILPLLGSAPRDLQALKAVGFWTAHDGDGQLSQLRVLVG